VTAYAFAPQDPTAVVGRRILAYGIDFLLGLTLAMVLAVPQAGRYDQTVSALEFRCGGDITVGDDQRTPVDSDLCVELGDEVRFVPRGDSGSVTMAFYGGFFGLGLLNLVLLQSATGASVGKLLVGLRVIRADGQVAGIGWMALRWVLLVVDAFCCFLPGAVLVFSTKGHRRLGDMAAGTLVVGKQQVGTPPLVPGVTVPALWPAAPGASWGAPTPTGVPGAWVPPPTSTPAPAPAPNPTPAATPSANGPIWDDARNTYIQWDAPREQWVQWDEARQEWIPIAT
jgi:uncharacterized RDD family membrane protein YckC